MHPPSELKLSFPCHVCDENIFSTPHKSTEIESNCFWNKLKIKCRIYISVFQNLECKLVTFKSMNNFYSSSSGTLTDF